MFSNSFPETFLKIHWKLPVPESPFKQSCRLETLNFIMKETLPQIFCEISKNMYFIEHLRATVSATCIGKEFW